MSNGAGARFLALPISPDRNLGARSIHHHPRLRHHVAARRNPDARARHHGRPVRGRRFRPMPSVRHFGVLAAGLPIASTASVSCCSSMSASPWNGAVRPRPELSLAPARPDRHRGVRRRGRLHRARHHHRPPPALARPRDRAMCRPPRASQVLGIPVGLFLANHWNWRVAFGAIVGLAIAGDRGCPAPDAAGERPSAAEAGRDAFAHLFATVSGPATRSRSGSTTCLRPAAIC